MKIHEYQAKEILKKFGVTVPEGRVAFEPKEAEEAYQALGGGTCVVKAQIHAGGRGKGGGVKLVKTCEELKETVHRMLGMKLVTHQTGPEGRIVKKIWIEKGCNIKRELYLGMVVDRTIDRPVLIGCEEGGMEIEEVASRAPEKILQEPFDPETGLMPFQARKMAYALHIREELVNQAVKFMMALSKAFVVCDASLLEINPLVETDNAIMALDAKISFDDNARFRHQDQAELRDLDEEDPQEIEASRYDLSYIRLGGNIGCMVNGAGLAMATMDIIKLHGGEPANFLDVGGSATTEKVTAAFKILLSDRNVKGVLINIFGGIMKCDVIAAGVIAAVKEVALQVPLVVRLEGTNVEKGRALLESSGLPIITASSMTEAASKAVAAVRR